MLGADGPSWLIAADARRRAADMPAVSPAMARQRISCAASLARATVPAGTSAWPRRAAAAERTGSPWYQAISDRVSAAQPSSSGYPASRPRRSVSAHHTTAAAWSPRSVAEIASRLDSHPVVTASSGRRARPLGQAASRRTTGR